MRAIAEQDAQKPVDAKAAMASLGDASDFVGLAMELLRAKKPERAEESMMKALNKIEDTRRILNGGS